MHYGRIGEPCMVVKIGVGKVVSLAAGRVLCGIALKRVKHQYFFKFYRVRRKIKPGFLGRSKSEGLHSNGVVVLAEYSTGH